MSDKSIGILLISNVWVMLFLEIGFLSYLFNGKHFMLRVLLTTPYCFFALKSTPIVYKMFIKKEDQYEEFDVGSIGIGK